MGSIGQFRYLGGAIGIAICTNILKKHISSTLSPILSPSQLNALGQSTQALDTLPETLQNAVRQAYGEGYNKQMQVMAGLGAAAFLGTLLMYERTPRRA